MKTFLNFFLILTLVSCSNEDKKIYSDDAKINNWVKENRSNFSDIKLEEISNYKGEEQRAIFRLIDSNNRKQIWIEKAEKLLLLYPNQSTIFDKLKNFIQDCNFESNLSDEQVTFLNQLIDEGRSNYNWDDEFIGITLCSFEFYNSSHNYNIFARNVLTNEADQPTCNCKWGGMFACGAMECKKGCEDDGDKGCGFLFMQTCTGVCK